MYNANHFGSIYYRFTINSNRSETIFDNASTAKQRSLTVILVQAFNYLKQNDLIPVKKHESDKLAVLRFFKLLFSNLPKRQSGPL